jgi:hypothetical protein
LQPKEVTIVEKKGEVKNSPYFALRRKLLHKKQAAGVAKPNT